MQYVAQNSPKGNFKMSYLTQNVTFEQKYTSLATENAITKQQVT